MTQSEVVSEPKQGEMAPTHRGSPAWDIRDPADEGHVHTGGVGQCKHGRAQSDGNGSPMKGVEAWPRDSEPKLGKKSMEKGSSAWSRES